MSGETYTDPLFEDIGDDDHDGHDHGLDEDDDAFCGPPTETDAVDEELEGIVEALVKAGYEHDFSEDAVYTALSRLVEAGEADDTPEMDESVDVKQTWIVNNGPAIRRVLREDLRLKFSEE